MKTILKYQLVIDVKNIQTIVMPKNANILKVDLLETNYENAVLWAYVDTENEKEIRQFEVFNTGQEMPQLSYIVRFYVGTFILINGKTSLHVFELKNSFKMKPVNGVEQ